MIIVLDERIDFFLLLFFPDGSHRLFEIMPAIEESVIYERIIYVQAEGWAVRRARQAVKTRSRLVQVHPDTSAENFSPKDWRKFLV